MRWLVGLFLLGLMGCAHCPLEVHMGSYTSFTSFNYAKFDFSTGQVSSSWVGTFTASPTETGTAPSGTGLLLRFPDTPDTTLLTDATLTLGSVVTGGGSQYLRVYAVLNSWDAFSAGTYTPMPRFRYHAVSELTFVDTDTDVEIDLDTDDLLPAWRGGEGVILLLAAFDSDVTVEEGFGATLTTTEVTADTGFVGQEYIIDYEHGDATGIIEDYKTGEWMPATVAIMDGYTRQWVHPSNYDPPDHMDRPRRARWQRAFDPAKKRGTPWGS